MPGYRQSKKSKKSRKSRKSRKIKNPYSSVKMRTSALGKAKSAPTQRKKSKSRSKVRSDPIQRKSKKSMSSRKKRALSKAKALLPRVMDDAEIEMRLLKEKRKNDDNIYNVDEKHLEGLKKLRDKKKQKVEDLAGIFEYQEDPIEPIALEDLPHMMGKVDIRGLDDPDAVLGYLKCPDRINYCFKTDPEIWKKCRVEEINNKYILPCKMSTIIERKIKDICEINNPFSGEEYIEMIKRNLDEYPFLMEQNVVSYLKRYLSYGREDIQPLEYRVYFQVKRNMFSEISDMDELVQLEMETWGKMWKEDEFLDAVNNFIGGERMK